MVEAVGGATAARPQSVSHSQSLDTEADRRSIEISRISALSLGCLFPARAAQHLADGNRHPRKCARMCSGF